MASVKNEIVANLDKLLQEYRLMYELDLSHKFKPIDTRDRNLCQDTCFLSGAKNKISTNQKARFKADMMNMHSVSIGSFHT